MRKEHREEKMKEKRPKRRRGEFEDFDDFDMEEGEKPVGGILKKIILAVIAVAVVGVIGYIGFGKPLLEKYSYGTEMADLDEYYGVTEGELAIILQDEMIDERAYLKNNRVYFDLDFVKELFNEGFYVDLAERELLYTTATQTLTIPFGEQSYSDKDGVHSMEYIPCIQEGERLFMAADFVKGFANFSCEQFERYLQIYTEWGEKLTAEISKDTQIRTKGGIKSPILREITKGETVEILEEMESWSKVKTADSVIGYVENKMLTNRNTVTEMAVRDYAEEEYASISLPEKVSLGWHYIGGLGGNDTLDAMVAEGKGMNVIAPTWFSLKDNEGNYRSYASTKYVEKAHSYGLQVWGVWDNFNYKNETGEDVSSYEILSVSAKRQKLVQSMVDTSLAVGVDGINIDFEGLTEDCGEHYIQFLKELSVLCRSNGLILSVDNYVPFNFNNYYRLDIQGKITDYVIIMGYDEHWHGSGDPGSVASINYVSNGLDRTLEQVPAEKVVNALAFYTILWKTDGAKVTDEYITLENIQDFVTRMNITPVWDEETCQNYAEWKSGSVLYQIWLEDAESLKVKLNVMNAKDIAGVAVWRLDYGPAWAWELLAAYKDM